MTLRRAQLAALAAFVAGVSSTPATAEVERVEIAQNATYEQESSGVSFAPKMGSFKRTQITRYHTANDVSAEYFDGDSNTWATIYVSRVGTPDPSLWFHRVSGVIQTRGGFEPDDDNLPQPVIFTAPGYDSPSAIRVSYPVSGSNIKSTGVAMIAYSSFIVKIRVSSESIGPDALDAVIDRFAAQLSMPAPSGKESSPYILTKCETDIRFAENAKITEAVGSEGLGLALSAQVDFMASREDGEQVRYCIDGASTPARAIYRADGQADGYLVSTDDTGRAVVVGNSLPNVLGGGTSVFSVQIQQPDQTLIMRSFDSLPGPNDLFPALIDANIVAISDRSGKITVTQMPELKAE